VFVLALGFGAPPAAGQAPSPAGQTLSRDVATQAFSDADVTHLIDKLDASLAKPTDAKVWTDNARFALWDFARTLQTERLTPAQEARVRSHLARIVAAHPDQAALISRSQHMVEALRPGMVAPEILGRDLDGHELKLSDFRGKVVVLVFSGDWCGICRSHYPVERQLLEMYKDRPFAIVGVNSDHDAAAARRTQAEMGLAFRSWWDGDGPTNTDGPIARAWNVVGWPTMYVLDSTGVIQFVDLWRDELVTRVGQLLADAPRARPPVALPSTVK
jgi:peroxiredoxin